MHVVGVQNLGRGSLEKLIKSMLTAWIVLRVTKKAKGIIHWCALHERVLLLLLLFL